LHDSTQSDYFHFTVTKPVEFSATVQQLPSNYETAPYSATNGCGPFSPAGPAAPDLTIDLTDSTGTTTLIHGDQTFSTTITSAGDYLLRISTLSRDNFIRPYLLNTLAIPACRFTDTFGTLTACTGASMTLSAPLVSVGPFTLQWYHDTTPIPGATSTTLVIDPLTPNDEGYYSCVAATPCGELTSAGTYLSVRTPRVGATSPASQTWTEGQTAKFQVTFTNGSAPYTSLQWMHDGQPIAGATGTTLLLPRLKLSDAGSYTFSFTTMCNSGVSAPGTLTVNPHCYADCDGSFGLSAIDFACFLDKFTAGDPYANCDGSTMPPTLNAGDFVCFLQKFRAGCQ
jgi:hypothetical protein